MRAIAVPCHAPSDEQVTQTFAGRLLAAILARSGK